MNKKRLISITSVLVVLVYIGIIGFFVYNLFNLANRYPNAEKNYIVEVEKNLSEILARQDGQMNDDLKQLIEKYPMELVVRKEDIVLYQTVPYSTNQQLLGLINKDAIVVEGLGNYGEGNNQLVVWYAVYHMPSQYYLDSFLSGQLWIIILSFVVLGVATVLLQQSLIKPLNQIRTSISKANEYQFEDIKSGSDEVNKNFEQFADKISTGIHAVSKKHTELEAELEIERERLKNTIMVARSLVHDLKTPIHQNLIENEFFVKGKENNSELVQLSNLNISMDDTTLKQINEILSMMQLDIHKMIEEKNEFDLVDLYLETLKLLTPSIRKKDLIVDNDFPEFMDVQINKASIQLLIHNLISNMVQYSKSRSTIVITINETEEGIILSHQNSSSKENIARMKKSEHIFDALTTKSEEHNYSSENGLFLIRDLTELLGGRYELITEEETVIINIIFPKGIVE